MSKEIDEVASYDDELDSLKLLMNPASSQDELMDDVDIESGDAADRDVSSHRQQLNLPDPNNVARFEVTDREWPDQELTPSICMWHDDKLAAFSLSIDDNHVDDHAFWLELAATYGWRWTWFVITNKIGVGAETWTVWQNMVNRGHEVQSHTYSHLCDGLFDIRKEYQYSQSQINSQLHSNKAITLAYPFGIKTNKGGSPCASIQSKNTRQEAARRYIAARDVVGALMCPAKIDFMKVPSISSMRNFFCANCNWAYFDSLFDRNSRNYRSWYSAHLHNVTTSQSKMDVRKALDHVRRKASLVWVGKFSEVAQYAQEYASASIGNLRSNQTQMTFDVYDEMHDQYFDFPLTIKIRLPRTWGNRIAALQNNVAIDHSVVTYGGHHYALVHAIPDKGRVTVKKR